ncbi:MAG: hypothetical protein LT106_03450 [Burkholderiaceae bacterium]|nr:hypothetical protein [Burkholderiaceae bacterium]
MSAASRPDPLPPRGAPGDAPRDEEVAGESRLQRIGHVVMQVLWPAFLMAIVAEGIFFSMIDPRELRVVADWLRESRVAAYTVAFFVFWALFAASSGITWFLAHGVGQVARREG